jgi:hypothetical protein
MKGRSYSQQLIFFVTYKWTKQAKMFVPGIPFQPNLMFANKGRAYPSEVPFGCSALGWAPNLTRKH